MRGTSQHYGLPLRKGLMARVNLTLEHHRFSACLIPTCLVMLETIHLSVRYSWD